MARPLSATDEDILQSAQQVMRRRGFEGFSLSEVAREVGLTRTAIALRFKR
jgi:AcrR family transcriptional regulator